MVKKIAILQSNYIPWKGYFDIINNVDEFILYDTAQYTKRDWRNRNLIKTDQGLMWLTIPVKQKQRSQSILDTEIDYPGWARKHWKSIEKYYKKTPYFGEYSERFKELYLERVPQLHSLSHINHLFLTSICEVLGINTVFSCSSDFCLLEGRDERLLGMCKDAGATTYLSGPAARGYLDVDLFQRSSIEAEWMDYTSYPEYRQLYPPFDHGVSILDLIFNEGHKASNFMKSFR